MSALRRTVTDLLLTVAAVLGVCCALLAVAGTVAGFGVVLFRTGSMSPTIPAGSAALVRTAPAAELRIGDVVTVDRPGRMPITHRIVSIAPLSGDDDAREIVMRGDANDANDPLPYQIESARRVIGSVPDVAPLITGWGRPQVLGTVALLTAAGVTLAFWPRRPGPATPGGAPDGDSGDDDVAPEARDIDPDLTTTGPKATTAHRRRRRSPAVRATAGTALLLCALGVVGATAPTSAHAAVDDDRHLSVDSWASATGPMVPGEVRDWVLTVRTDGVRGRVTRDLEVTGTGNPALTVQVDRCADPDCTRTTPLVSAHTPAPGGVLDLPDQTAPGTEVLRVRATLDPQAGREVQGLRTGMTFVATGDGEIVEAPADDADTPPDDPSATPDGPSGTPDAPGVTPEGPADRPTGGPGTDDGATPGSGHRHPALAVTAPLGGPLTALVAVLLGALGWAVLGLRRREREAGPDR
ncbi:signal peptidase I [Cellulomonas taurus]|uniref:signal peptidase I n=1 Tax=Cellulomonas taurus TaxID=2729175 RepID=UPI00197EE0BB|nr:signal peptidase I [Cellulomonas taurus]